MPTGARGTAKPLFGQFLAQFCQITLTCSKQYFEQISEFSGGGGGGGGVHPVFVVVVKLDFEIAVDQQTEAHDQTFEGVPDSGCPLVPARQPHHYLVNFGSILSNRLKILKNIALGCSTCNY